MARAPNTLRKATKAVLIILAGIAVVYWGIQFGWLDSEEWLDLRRGGRVQMILLVGLFILALVFGDELKTSSNVDAMGRAIEDDERGRRAGNRSVPVIIAVFIAAELLFRLIVFLSGT
jgi:hypothetical protein